MNTHSFLRRLVLNASCALILNMFFAIPAWGAPPAASSSSGPCTQVCHGHTISCSYLCILEPLPGGPEWIAPSTRPLENFWQYVNNGVWQFVFRIGVAVAVLNGVIGGQQIVFSNGDSGAIEKGRHRLIWSMLGLLMLVLAGVIMNYINPIAFHIV